jgi:uncharacterized protein with HEPN domain
MRSQRQYIQDILEAMTLAGSFVEGVSREELETDIEKKFALQRAFEIIGEATKQLDTDLREQYPKVPWDSMAGTRDILIHEYFAVDLDVVLRTVREDFPRDKKLLPAFSATSMQMGEDTPDSSPILRRTI